LMRNEAAEPRNSPPSFSGSGNRVCRRLM